MNAAAPTLDSTPVLTEAILWDDYLADIVETIEARLPLSSKDRARLRKLPQRPMSKFIWFGKNRTEGFKLLLQSDGPLWLFDLSSGGRYLGAVDRCVEDLREYQNQYIAELKALQA